MTVHKDSMVKHTVSETENQDTEDTKPFVFLVIEGRKRFKPSEIAVLEWRADLEKKRFLNAEAILRIERRIGA